MAWYDFLTGTPARNEQVQRFNPQQQSAFSQLLQQGSQGLQNLQNPQNFGSQFDPIAKQARTQFNQQTIPSIAERFTSMGGGQRSSAFSGALGQAGAGLDEGLASLKSQFGLQQQGQQQGFLQNLLGMGLTPQFETLQHQREPGAIENMLGPALQALMMYFGGGTSALGGAGMGAMGSMMNKGGGLGQSQGYGSGFANPSLWSPSMQNLNRGF